MEKKLAKVQRQFEKEHLIKGIPHKGSRIRGKKNIHLLMDEDYPTSPRNVQKRSVKQLNIQHQEQIQKMKEEKLRQRKHFWEKNKKLQNVFTYK